SIKKLLTDDSVMIKNKFYSIQSTYIVENKPINSLIKSLFYFNLHALHFERIFVRQYGEVFFSFHRPDSICTHTYTHTHTHKHLHTLIHTHAHTHKHKHLHTLIHTHAHTHTHTHAHTRTHTQTLTHPYTHTRTHSYTLIHTHTHT